MIIVTHDPTAAAGSGTGKNLHVGKKTTITEFPEVMEQVKGASMGELTGAGKSTLKTIMPVIKDTVAPTVIDVAKDVNGNFGTRASAVPARSMADTEYDDIIARAAAQYGVEASLIKAMIKMESDFNPNDVSSSGAVGLMQLMPETAKGLGVTDSYDPEQNIMGGTKYIAQKLKEYDGNLELALSAYNAGSGTVRKYGGVPPQCRVYIAKILSYKEAYEVAAAVS